MNKEEIVILIIGSLSTLLSIIFVALSKVEIKKIREEVSRDRVTRLHHIQSEYMMMSLENALDEKRHRIYSDKHIKYWKMFMEESQERINKAKESERSTSKD
jgi:cob(I)alamin adenosyltransferase